VESRGKAPVEGLGDEVPQKLKLLVYKCMNCFALVVAKKISWES